MTEQEWQLQRQVYELQIELAKALSQVCQANHDRAQAQLAALGDTYKPPEAPPA